MSISDHVFTTNKNIHYIYNCYSKLPRVVYFDMKIIGQAWYDSTCRIKAIEQLDLKSGERVLDAACGMGFNFPLIQQGLKNEGQLIAVDLSDQSLTSAEDLVTENKWSNVELYRTCLPQIPETDSLTQPFVWSYFTVGGNNFRRTKQIRRYIEHRFSSCCYSNDTYGGYYYNLTADK